MYQEIKIAGSDKVSCIKRIPDNSFIPLDPLNVDYQEYLKWLAEGNQPLPAE